MYMRLRCSDNFQLIKKLGFHNLQNYAMAPITGKIACKRKELDLGETLKGGQSFRWCAIENGSKFRGVFAGEVWTLNQNDNYILFTAHKSKLQTARECKTELMKYFNLHISLEENLEKWSKADIHFEKFSKIVEGVRILNQDVIENLFSFICSANNNITRISSMIEKLCRHFGEKICQVDEEWYYDFPTIESLAETNVQSMLSKEGFGYRAPYIHKTAKMLIELGGREWLVQLSKEHGANYEDSRQKIQILPGVGPKVADCICLMSLGHLEAIPVDTHIYQIARETYLPDIKLVQSVTPAIYQTVNRYFRETWGPLAGWAQAIAFCTRIKDNSRRKKTEKNGPKKKMKK